MSFNLNSKVSSIQCHSLSRLPNIAPQTGQLKQQNLFLRFLKARSARSRCGPVQVLAKALFLVCNWPPSCCVFTWPFLYTHRDRGSNMPLFLLVRTQVLFDEGPISRPHLTLLTCQGPILYIQSCFRLWLWHRILIAQLSP